MSAAEKRAGPIFNKIIAAIQELEGIPVEYRLAKKLSEIRAELRADDTWEEVGEPLPQPSPPPSSNLAEKRDKSLLRPAITVAAPEMPKEVKLVCGNGHPIDAAHLEAFKRACQPEPSPPSAAPTVSAHFGQTILEQAYGLHAKTCDCSCHEGKCRDCKCHDNVGVIHSLLLERQESRGEPLPQSSPRTE